MKSRKAFFLLLVLIALLVVVILLNTAMGAVNIPVGNTINIIAKALGVYSGDVDGMQEAVLLQIRLPRILLALLVGGSLAIAGTALQGLFRNPLADPALIGISSGASMTAVMWIVWGHYFVGSSVGLLSNYALSTVSFLGALLTAVLVYMIAQLNGKTLITIMLLAGIAINALTGAVTGIFTFTATESQLRSITFWMLGSLGGATWDNVLGILPFTLIPAIVLQTMGKTLNAFSLGEHTAALLGIRTERAKKSILLLATLCVGASVAVSGVIGFVGLVVPHLIRLLIGPDYRSLLPLSMLMGMVLLLGADLLARTLIAPIEIPIGIITALSGAPFFLYILLKDKKSQKIV